MYKPENKIFIPNSQHIQKMPLHYSWIPQLIVIICFVGMAGVSSGVNCKIVYGIRKVTCPGKKRAFDCTANNHFLIKKKILNLRNYFLKRETDFLNKKNDS